jgi:fructokinase
MAATLLRLIRREHGRRVIVLDPNVRPGLIGDDVYRERLRSVAAMSTIVKASDSDLEWLDVDAERLIGDGVRLVVVTRGAQGAVAVHGTTRVDVAARPVDVVDTIGAGDAFGAGLVEWLHEHHQLKRDLSLREREVRAAAEHACAVAAEALARRRAGLRGR